MGERIEKLLDDAAKPTFLNSGHDYRVLWNAVPHEKDEEHPEDKDWADSEPDPSAP